MYEHVRIRPFNKLCERHEWHKYADVPVELIGKYAGKIPDFLLAIWEQYGFTSHGDGEVWFTNPDDFNDIIQAFFGKDYPFIVFARDSFGMMHAILKEKLYVIHPQVSHAQYMGELELFEIRINSIIRDEKGNKYHRAALKKLGPINEEQMYGYIPMLALGGDGSLKETQIVQMNEYLLLVADVATEAVRNGWNPLGLPDL